MSITEYEKWTRNLWQQVSHVKRNTKYFHTNISLFHCQVRGTCRYGRSYTVEFEWYGLELLQCTLSMSSYISITFLLAVYQKSASMLRIKPEVIYKPVSFKMTLLSSFLSSYTLVPATSRSSFNLWESGAVAIWLIWQLEITRHIRRNLCKKPSLYTCNKQATSMLSF